LAGGFVLLAIILSHYSTSLAEVQKLLVEDCIRIYKVLRCGDGMSPVQLFPSYSNWGSGLADQLSHIIPDIHHMASLSAAKAVPIQNTTIPIPDIATTDKVLNQYLYKCALSYTLHI